MLLTVCICLIAMALGNYNAGQSNVACLLILTKSMVSPNFTKVRGTCLLLLNFPKLSENIIIATQTQSSLGDLTYSFSHSLINYLTGLLL